MTTREYRVRLFAGVKAAVGADEISVFAVPDLTAGGLREKLAEANPDAAGLVRACRIAVDREFAGVDDPVPTDAEIALIPPVSGG